MKKHLFIAAAAVVFVVACKNEANEKAIASLNGLRAKLVSTDSVLGTLDRTEIERLETEVKNNTQFISFNVNKVGDTLDWNTTLLLTEYRELRKKFAAYAEDHKNLSAAVDSASKNLDNLEHDLRNNTLAEGLTPEGSVKAEEEQVNRAYDIAMELRSGYTDSKASYDTLAPKVSEYMKQINEKLATQAAPKQ